MVRKFNALLDSIKFKLKNIAAFSLNRLIKTYLALGLLLSVLAIYHLQKLKDASYMTKVDEDVRKLSICNLTKSVKRFELEVQKLTLEFENFMMRNHESQFFEPRKPQEPGMLLNKGMFHFIIDPQRRFKEDGSQSPPEPVEPVLLLNLVTVAPYKIM